MTRKRWADLRDKHLQSPEAQTAYEAAGRDLEQELAEHEKKLCDHCFAELHGDCVPGQECECECQS